jgi:tetratricopeptide (TPR) repeat protein
VTRLLDGALVAALLGLTFLLGAFPLKDTDFWWHLRTGDIIRQTWRLPVTDWYTFAAADHAWIDLHWLFQVLLSWGYQLGGVPLLTLAKCVITCAAVALLVSARKPSWPLWVMLLAWLPALLVLSGRMYVRPETLTLLYLAAFLAVLVRIDERPRLAWLLPPVQVLWANSQGLFVLGPIVLACALVDAGLRPGAFTRARRRWWRTVGAASIATLAACLLNPYGLLGATFPLQIARTMNDEVFSRTIAELMPVGRFIAENGWRNLPLQLHLGTAVLGALSFLVPLAWSAGLWLTARDDGQPAPKPRRGKKKDRVAEAPSLWWPRPFRVLLYVAFTVLGLKATRNSHQFAAVVGAVTAWNLGEWAAWLRARRDAKSAEAPSTRLAPRLATLAVFILTIGLVASGTFYAWAGEGRTIGLGEEPLWFPHAAVEAAGAPGMPDRFVCFHNGHAALYAHRWGPDRKVFADARLEVIGRDVYRRYLDLERGIAADQPGWTEELAALGSPGVLVDLVHSQNAQTAASVLAKPGWRCIWFDAVAAVFAPPTAPGAPPAVDFAARHYRPDSRTEPQGRPALLATAEALSHVALFLQSRGHAETARPLVLLGLDYARRARDADPADPQGWKLVGTLLATLDMVGTPEEPVVRFSAPWDPVFDLVPARATYALKHARRRAPEDSAVLLTLGLSLQSRGLYEEALPVWMDLATLDPPGVRQVLREKARQDAILQAARAQASLGTAPAADWRNLAELDAAVHELLSQGRAASAADLLARAYPERSRPWEVADRIGTLWLHVGRPEDARAAWRAAVDPPRPALVASRIGMTYLVTDEPAEAARHFEQATQLEPNLFEAWYGLALAEQDLGRADAAVRAAARAVETAPTDIARSAARTVQRLAEPFAHGVPPGPPQPVTTPAGS